jgi:hypothetical protein
MNFRPPPRTARPPGTNWQDSYFALDERYRQLQKKFNEQEQALKLVKVARRKEEAPPASPSLSSISASRRPSMRSSTRAASSAALASVHRHGDNADDTGRSQAWHRGVSNPLETSWFRPPPQSPPYSLTQPSRSVFDHVGSDVLHGDGHHDSSSQVSGSAPSPTSLPRTAADPMHDSSFPAYREPHDDVGRTQEYVSVSSAAGPQSARAAAITAAGAWGGEAAALPDPAMVWGTDGQSSLQNYVVASALYHANEELRRKLNESATTLQTLQQELASSRAQHTAVQSRLDSAAQQMHQLVRERDLATQKFTNASHTITDMERTLRNRVAEEEKVRFSMESQIAELRSRLVVGADSNELLQKDVRSLLAETRDRTGEAMQLRSKLALAESALSAQKNVNENMLVELKSLNVQLVEERKRLLTVTREAQVASLNGTRIADLQEQLQRVQAERNTIEQEHVRLMAEFVRVTEDALRHAREEVRTDVADWKAAAQHWEEVSQLLYKDIAERTKQHLQCRAECEEAKEQRDATALQVRALKDEVALLSAKLDVVWPSHATDTKDFSLEDIRSAFGSQDRRGIFLFDERRRKAAAQRRRREECATATSTAAAATRTTTEEAGGVKSEASAEEDANGLMDSSGGFGDMEEDESFQRTAHLLGDLPADPTTAAAQLQELHEVNASLLSDVRQLRLTNDLLQDRLDRLTGRRKEEEARMAAAEASLQRRERAGHTLLEKQLDRVAFLEAQVRSLRGYNIAPNTPVDRLGDNENIFELFLGQLVAAEVPEGVEVPDLFSHVFCSVDFLLHETITTPAVRGLNGFFDVTAAFCVSMDTLLIYYLHTRQLLVQLHRVRSEGETTAAITAVAASQRKEVSPEEGEEGKGASNGRGSVGGSSAVTTTSSSTHPSLRMAENMFETVAEGQVSLVDIVASAECQHAARPTIKGHVRLCTPGGRHIASLEFCLTARRPYTSGFLRALQEVTEKTLPTIMKGDEELTGNAPAPADGASSRLLNWVRTTASTSADADLQPMGDPLPSMRANRSNDETIDAANGVRLSQRRPSAQPLARIRQSQMQLVPVTEVDEVPSSSSSFYVRQRSHVSEAGGAFVVHLPAPSPPPSHLASRKASPWCARPPSSVAGDGEERSGKGKGRCRSSSTASPALAEHEPSTAPPHGPSSFMHVERSLLSQPTPAHGHRGDTQLTASITCLWVDVERLELPADLPLPIPRLSCYFSVAPLRKEVWLAAPPTARYTWPYTVDNQHQRDGGAGSEGGVFGTSLPVQSVTQLASVVREPLVLFFLDADAMASPSPSTAANNEPCVWAMAVCEWHQAVQHPDTPHSFRLPLVRRDQSVVAGAVVRLTLSATTTDYTLPTTENAPPLRAPLQHDTTASRGGYPASTLAASSALAPPPFMSQESVASPPPLLSARQPRTVGDASSLDASMAEELLQLEYDQHVRRNGT